MSRFDARVWMMWLLTGALLSISIRNPLFLAMLLVTSRVVEMVCAPPRDGAWRPPFLRLCLLILLFSTLFNALTAHVGDTVLVILPESWWLIGGAVTLEAAVYGFISGLSLVTLLSLFLAMNAIVPVGEMTGFTPGALYELGLVMLVAITYVPETVRQFQRVREAQAIRGHQFRGLRDWHALAIPLLVGGLERALNLAETMVARGYGSTSQSGQPLRVRLMLLAGLALTLAGALWLTWAGRAGWALIAAGSLPIVWVYRDLSNRTVRTKYRPSRWSAPDSIALIAAAAPLLLLVPLPFINRAALAYSPYPLIGLPAFSTTGGLLLLGLAAPAALALLAPRRER